MICTGPIPEHLVEHDWYACHQAWLHKCGLLHHDFGSAGAHRAYLCNADLSHMVLSCANLRAANLRGADMTGADLTGANLAGANVSGARLTHSDLTCADLPRANLTGADLSHAVLARAFLTNADLRGANLTGANLAGTNLSGAILDGTVLTDGRTLGKWQADPLLGLCTEPEAVARATAAWDRHTWRDCPLHAGMGINGLRDIDDETQHRLAACFLALFDGYHLPKPGDKGAA